VAGIGWLVGVGLLWTSTRWTKTQKILGIVAPPGGLAAVALWALAAQGASAQDCYTAYGPGHRVLQHQCFGGGFGVAVQDIVGAMLAALWLAPLSYLAVAMHRSRSHDLPLQTRPLGLAGYQRTDASRLRLR